MSALADERSAARDAASSATLARVAPIAVAALSLAVLVQRATFGDYEQDAGAPMRALIHGHVGRAIAHQPLMGSFALLARAPFALFASLAGAGELGIYRAGTAACALAAAGLTVYLARHAEHRAWAPALPLIVLLNPASVSAVQSGHPEELLAATLLVAALLTTNRSVLAAGALLGLALATKQWAVVGIGPALWLVPAGRRLLAAGIAAATALALTLPLVVGSASAFSATSHQAATAPVTTGRATIWFLLAQHTTLHLHVPAGVRATVSIATVPEWIARGSHPAIVVLPLLATLLVWRRKPTMTDALALLTLALLARCVLDPVDNLYYHFPFVLALLAYELSRRRVPALTLFASAGLWLTFNRLDVSGTTSPFLTNACYLACTLTVGTFLVHSLWRPRDRAAA